MAGGALPSNVLATADLNRVSGRLEDIGQKAMLLIALFPSGRGRSRHRSHSRRIVSVGVQHALLNAGNMTRRIQSLTLSLIPSLSHVCLLRLRRHPVWLRLRLHLGRLVNALFHHHHHRTRPSHHAARAIRHLGFQSEFDRFHSVCRVSALVHCRPANTHTTCLNL
jgi:hypothetical protein